MNVTIQPVAENLLTISSRRVPVFEKNVPNTFTCKRNDTAVMISIRIISTARSVTTVPRALAKSVCSLRVSTPQRANSPIRGIMRLTAYERKMELVQTDALGRSPTGLRVCFHRNPRNTIAIIPKGKERIIHVQSILLSSTSEILEKSKSRYIQYKIAPPSNNGRAIFTVFRNAFFASIFFISLQK